MTTNIEWGEPAIAPAQDGVKKAGFVKVPNWLIDDSDLSLHELAVYMVLLRFRDPQTGKCFPGITTIADRARISRKTVERIIKQLEGRGLVKVERRSTLTVNQPNLYEVSLPKDAPSKNLLSAKGTRIPGRSKATDSESLGKGVHFEPTDSELLPTDSESVGTDSESVPPQTPSRPKKIHGTRSTNEIHGEDVTHALASESENSFSFDVRQDRATEKQIAYLKDLATQLAYSSGGGTPGDEQIARWRKLTTAEATKQLHGYLKALGRPGDIDYPEYGTDEYNALSEAGKEFADTAGTPDSVFEYAYGLKENA